MQRRSLTQQPVKFALVAALLVLIGAVFYHRNETLISHAQGRVVPQRPPVTGATNSTGKLPPAPFDLVFTSLDRNGIALNPKWGWQITHGAPPSPTQCANGPFWSPCRTNMPPPITFDFAEICKLHPYLYGVAGHANWSPATYVGRITWETHSYPCDSWSGLSSLSCDDDYNFNLYTPNDAGLTTRDSIECEFDSDETINHFDTPWWNFFHNAVDKGDDLQVNESLFKEHGELGRYAIVTGLLNLEMVHGGSSELHPVWAIAVRVKDDDPMDEVWAMFIRRWGNEGFCSGDQHYLMGLPNNTYTFRLPWRPGASDLKLGPNTAFNGEYDLLSGFLPKSDFLGAVQAVPNWGVLVSFPVALGYDFPSSTVSPDLIEGELHLQWPGGKWAQPAPIPAQIPAGKPLTCEEGCAGDCYEFRRGTQQYQQCITKCNQECQRKGQGYTQPPAPEKLIAAMLAKTTRAQREEVARLTPAQPVSRGKRAVRLSAVTRVQSLPREVAGPPTVQFKSVPDPKKRARNQRLLDTLNKILGRRTTSKP